MQLFRSPGTVVGRFVARRTMRSAAMWAVIFGIIVTAKSIGYASAYPTLASRLKVAASFAANPGVVALLGIPHHIEIVASGAAWNTVGAITLIGSIWAFLLATKTFRGEEDAGRWELLLSGQTTAARGAANTLGGLAASLTLLYVLLAAVFAAVGSYHKIDFGPQPALFFALAAVSGPAMFLSIGALVSQLMPTRSRAASLAAVVFGVSFLLRAMADTTSAHWLLNATPLGWVERLQPLYHSQPVWLLPIGGLVILCCGLTIFLASRRDLGDSIVADKDSAEPRTKLLNTPLGFGLRLTRPASLGWLAGLTLVSIFFGVLTKSVTQVLGSSTGAGKAIGKLVHAAQTFGAQTFLGIIFFLLMTLTMVFVANSVGAMREEEASGYLDNLLVRPISRQRWFWGRIALLSAVIVAIGLVTSLAVWLGMALLRSTIPLHSLLLAGANLLAPALLLGGIGIAALGLTPRLTTVIAFSAIAWSFLVQLLSSGLNLNHWILDTSILNHVALAPAVNPNWQSAGILAGLGVVLSLIGALAFNRRDLQAE